MAKNYQTLPRARSQWPKAILFHNTDSTTPAGFYRVSASTIAKPVKWIGKWRKK